MDTIEDYYRKVANFELSQEFIKRNLMFEVESKDPDLIPQSAVCLQKNRRNSVFFLDKDLNLVEYDTAKQKKILYQNKEKVSDFGSLKDEDHVHLVIAEDFSCLAIFVVRMEKKESFEASRYQFTKFKIDTKDMCLQPEGVFFDRLADASKPFHSFSEIHRVRELPSLQLSQKALNDLFSLGDASILRMNFDGSKVYLLHDCDEKFDDHNGDILEDPDCKGQVFSVFSRNFFVLADNHFLQLVDCPDESFTLILKKESEIINKHQIDRVVDVQISNENVLVYY